VGGVEREGGRGEGGVGERMIRTQVRRGEDRGFTGGKNKAIVEKIWCCEKCISQVWRRSEQRTMRLVIYKQTRVGECF
jgi:hypothetical protein